MSCDLNSGLPKCRIDIELEVHSLGLLSNVILALEQGLVESWRKKEDKEKQPSTSLPSAKSPKAQQVKLRAIGTRGAVYCILRCEGQVKRTALARGHHNPVWKEDIAFKSVRISSDLQVLTLRRYCTYQGWGHASHYATRSFAARYSGMPRR